MSPGLHLQLMARESRGSRWRLGFFVLCLGLGVAAVVAVAGLTGAMDRAVRTEARSLLAADLVVSARRPPPAALERLLAARPDVRRADLKEMVTMVSAGVPAHPPTTAPASALVELKAVGPGYPFYGELRLNPSRPLGELLGEAGVVVTPDLLTRLGLAPGDRLRIGGESFTITGTIAAEPDRAAAMFTLGPRVFVSLAGLARTDLERFGSRIDYRTLLALPAGSGAAAARELAATLRRGLPAGWEVETYAEAQPALRQGLRQMERYLGLVALLSLLIGGLGVAQTVRAWLAGRLDDVAALRCLGVKPGEVVTLYVGQTALLGLAGSLVGAAAGLGVQALLPRLAAGLLPASLELAPWQPAAALRGLALGTGVAVLFSLPPLLALRRVPPARVLRRDAEPLPASRPAAVLLAATLVAGVWATAALQAGSPRLGAWFAAGLLVAAGLLALAALGVSRAARRLRRAAPRIWLRHGLAALGRPGAATLSAVVALGLGVLVVLAMGLVERGLSARLAADLPTAAPTAFFIDIQPDQWPGVRELLLAAGAEDLQSVPVVMARLAAIDGREAGELARAPATDHEARERRWALTREQRLTYLERLPDDNRVVAGTLWGRPEPEVSVEREFAEELGVGLGSRLRFDVQGVPLELTVGSLREVDWRTFGINFFLVVEPGVLEEAPQFRLATARLPPGREQAIQDRLARRYPNVTMLRIREVLEKVLAVLGRLGLGVRLLGGFTVGAGVVILAGAVSAGTVRRAREAALLKTLGFTRGQVLGLLATEYALVGAAAAAIGAAGASALSFWVLTRLLEIEWSLSPLYLGVAALLAVLLTVAAGLAASLEAWRHRPLEILRRG